HECNERLVALLACSMPERKSFGTATAITIPSKIGDHSSSNIIRSVGDVIDGVDPNSLARLPPLQIRIDKVMKVQIDNSRPWDRQKLLHFPYDTVYGKGLLKDTRNSLFRG